jgi:hypothetical protein
MKPQNKAARQAMKKQKEPALHPWQKGQTVRKTKRAFRYEVFDDNGGLIGFITSHGKVR